MLFRSLVVVFFTWLAFQLWVDALDRPPILEQMLYTIMGGWLANIALAVRNGKDKGDNDD